MDTYPVSDLLLAAYLFLQGGGVADGSGRIVKPGLYAGLQAGMPAQFLFSDPPAQKEASARFFSDEPIPFSGLRMKDAYRCLKGELKRN